jgi:hypothetical protein
MRLAIRVLLGVLIVTLAVVLWRQHRETTAREGWGRFAEAHDQGSTVAALEAARDQAAGSPARPWLDFELAFKLYEQGTPADLERALQITRESMATYANHPAAESLRKLDSAIKTFLPQAASSGSSGT